VNGSSDRQADPDPVPVRGYGVIQEEVLGIHYPSAPRRSNIPL